MNIEKIYDAAVAAYIDKVDKYMKKVLTDLRDNDDAEYGDVESAVKGIPSVYEAFSLTDTDVKLEIGPLASWTPWEKKSITSLVGEFEPHLEIQSFDVPVIKAERTFWEKIEALHHEHYRPETKKAPKRFSRHYYDVYKMFGFGVFNVAKHDLALLVDIVDFTRKFYPRSWAHFELCKPGTMLLMPSEHAMPVMKADYAAMRAMIYGDYPSFDEILRIIKQLESEINSSL